MARDVAAVGDGRAHAELSSRDRAFVAGFNDLRLEWVRIGAELFGTFLLVLVAVGAGIVDSTTHGGVGRLAEIAAPGLMVMAIILSLGAISGAHLNPVVTIAFAFRTDFRWSRVPGYIAAQLAGSVAACLILLAVFGHHGVDGATIPGAAFTSWQAAIVEALLTLGLVTVVLGAASGAQNIGPLSAIAAGGYVILAGLWAGPVSGASMNPARSFGPDVIRGDLSTLWIYLVGPLAGALLAVLIAFLLRGPGGSAAATRAAEGTGR
ncbi:MAG: aquaporin [Actinomycetota bacterium]|nr:aquaporin [Actinomycetota bacterium]